MSDFFHTFTSQGSGSHCAAFCQRSRPAVATRGTQHAWPCSLMAYILVCSTKLTGFSVSFYFLYFKTFAKVFYVLLLLLIMEYENVMTVSLYEERKTLIRETFCQICTFGSHHFNVQGLWFWVHLFHLSWG